MGKPRALKPFFFSFVVLAYSGHISFLHLLFSLGFFLGYTKDRLLGVGGVGWEIIGGFIHPSVLKYANHLFLPAINIFTHIWLAPAMFVFMPCYCLFLVFLEGGLDTIINGLFVLSISPLSRLFVDCCRFFAFPDTLFVYYPLFLTSFFVRLALVLCCCVVAAFCCFVPGMDGSTSYVGLFLWQGLAVMCCAVCRGLEGRGMKV